jgi:hypothetical protein
MLLRCENLERPMSQLGLGCVKTRKSNLRIEISSRHRRFEEQKRWRALSAEKNRENNSAPSSRADVFTRMQRTPKSIDVRFDPKTTISHPDMKALRRANDRLRCEKAGRFLLAEPKVSHRPVD